MAYIGKTPTIGNFQVCDAISVVNNQAAYTMQVGGVNVSPESSNHMLVSLNGILQRSGSSFTVSGSTITFASNLVTGDVIDFIQILGNVLDLGVPSDATVSTAKIVDGAITSAKLASGVGGKVLQVVNTTKTDTFSTTSGSYTDVTGLSAAITPSSTSNKIYVVLSIYVSNDTQTGNAICNIVRDSTQLQETVVRIPQEGQAVYRLYNLSMTDFDSPATTSATTYKIQIKTNAGTMYVNRAANQGGFSNTATATLTLMEIGT